MNTFEFSLYPLKETDRKGFFDVPVIRVEAPSLPEAHAIALPQVPEGSRIFCVIEVTAADDKLRGMVP